MATTPGLGFSGQETGIVILNRTTGDQKLSDMIAKSFSFTIKTNVSRSMYLGQVGPTIRSFYDGYEFSLDYDPQSPVTLVDFMTLLIAKTQRKIVDEFAIRSTFGALDTGKFGVTFRDVQWDSPSFNMADQQGVLASTLKGQGNILDLKRIG